MKPEDEIRRGNEAKMLLDHPIYQEAWKAALDGISAKRRDVPMKDTEMHTRLILAEQIALTVKRYIEDVMTTGKMAEKQLELAQQKRRFFAIGR